MKVLVPSLVVSWLLSSSCATVGSNPYAYEELESCPVSMTEQQHASGVVQCRAMCSSYGRDMHEFGKDCRCFCAPSAPTYRAKPKRKIAPPVEGQT